MDPDYWKKQKEAREAKFQLPLINFTDVNERIKHHKYYDGAFPRWGAIGRAVNPEKAAKYTTFFSIIGVKISYILINRYVIGQ